jgi:hypothetical protein
LDGTATSITAERNNVDFNFGNSRERVVQQVLMFNRVAPAAGRSNPVSENIDQHHLVTGFMVTNISTAPASVFLGVDPQMHASIEIVPGSSPFFSVLQEGRQFYELQILIAKIASQTAQDLIKIPVLTWDLTHWYIEAGTDSDIEVTITAFPMPYL